MATGNLPLLLKGYNSDQNGGNSTLAKTSGTIQWNNVFDSGRGDVGYIDAIETDTPSLYGAGTNAVATISVSGVQVIVNAYCADFAPYSNPGNYYITPLKQPGGQTLSLNLSGGAALHGLQVLAFYQNDYDTPQMRSRLYSSKLKRRFQDTFYTVATNAKFQNSNQFTVPIANGNVVGIELLAYINTGSTAGDLGTTNLSMYVNGVSIFENVNCLYCHNTCTRPQIFPIKINPGDTFYFSTDASAAGITVNLTVGARLYFDDSNA